LTHYERGLDNQAAYARLPTLVSSKDGAKAGVLIRLQRRKMRGLGKGVAREEIRKNRAGNTKTTEYGGSTRWLLPLPRTRGHVGGNNQNATKGGENEFGKRKLGSNWGRGVTH